MFGRSLQLEMPLELAVFTLAEQLEASGSTVLARFDQRVVASESMPTVWLSLWHAELGSDSPITAPPTY